jgi:hypothetical protein
MTLLALTLRRQHRIAVFSGTSLGKLPGAQFQTDADIGFFEVRHIGA